jgi:hypothetical protein
MAHREYDITAARKFFHLNNILPIKHSAAARKQEYGVLIFPGSNIRIQMAVRFY